MTLGLTCYGGVKEIGGNKILLEEGRVRLWLDFGTPFARHKQYFNEYLNPRPARGLWDLVALGLLPLLRGLYRQDLEPEELWERFPPARDVDPSEGPVFVLLTHAHLDHLGDAALLNAEIPIVATPESGVIARVMQITGQGGFLQEWSYCNERVPEKAGLLKAQGPRQPYRNRPFYLLDEVGQELVQWWQQLPASRGVEGEPPQPFPGRVGHLVVHRWPVDHSIPGAAAYVIETSAGPVAYTGDLRFHGRLGEATRKVAEAWARMDLAVLLCEGTRLGDSSPPVGEDEVRENALDLTRAAAGRLVVADFAARNLERLQTFLEVARETGRRLLVQPKDAYLLEALALVSPGFRHAVADEDHLGVYDDVKSQPRRWEQDVRERWQKRLLGPKAVARNPGDYILCCSLWDMNDLLDLPRESLAGGVYLYANSKAYDEEQAVDLERLRQWVKHLGLRLEGDPEDAEAKRLHASGHAPEEELVEFVREVQPRRLVPVHTEHPHRWRSCKELCVGVCV
ncbi:MBL fold metallo-hydrolase RNA specificity domain-containing protein [Thermus scotoductus]|uniref:Zn-dependent metallo-hydrolase RNA specificity domain-containing protein n=1 Tax=Thermus scotoductus TaxID=37636 RepID=A0A430S4B1_THESC|nr:MBL fold metallo-hydrolase RNA specificity domain-containing protein [Thermus scotoductus]RTH28710.1 hypothetical protein CSW40_00370 [Thermus scotoductus]RTI33533.1 hypothetical protein CSW18_14090 [Thermus scotoductus]